MTIVLLSDALEIRARQQRELTFYLTKRAEIERRLFNLRQELNLTDKILAIIRKERQNELSIAP